MIAECPKCGKYWQLKGTYINTGGHDLFLTCPACRAKKGDDGEGPVVPVDGTPVDILDPGVQR